MAEAGGAAQEALGGVAAPGSPRCAREIGRQEAAAENPGAGNGRCRPPDAPQVCGTRGPAAPPPRGWVPPGDALNLLVSPFWGDGGARGLPWRGSSSSPGEP